MAKSCFIRIKEALDAFFKENVVPNTKAFDSITDKIQYLGAQLHWDSFYREILSWIFRELGQFIKDQTSNSSPSWRPINSTINTLWKLMMENTILKAWKTVSSSMRFYFADGDEAIATETSQTKSSTNATNQLLLPSWMLVARRGENWYLVSWFR